MSKSSASRYTVYNFHLFLNSTYWILFSCIVYVCELLYTIKKSLYVCAHLANKVNLASGSDSVGRNKKEQTELYECMSEQQLDFYECIEATSLKMCLKQWAYYVLAI